MRVRSLVVFVFVVCTLLGFFSPPAGAADFTDICRTGTLQQIGQAIQRGARVNSRDAKGELPLVAALDNKAAPEVLQLLVRSGARINAANASGMTALHVAVHRYAPELTVELLRLKADVNADGGDIGSPLMASLLREPVDPQLVNLLIQTGGNVNFTDKGGLTPLIQAIAVKAPPEILALLLKNGAEIDKTSPKIGNETPLMVAAGYSPAPVVKLLLDAGASTTAKSASGKTAKDYAAEAKMTENLNLIAAKTQSGETKTAGKQSAGTKLPPPVVVDLNVVTKKGEAPVSAPTAPAAPTASVPAEVKPQTPPAPSPVETPPAPSPRQRPASVPRAETLPRSFLPQTGMFEGVSIAACIFIFLGCCLGYWAGPLIVLRDSLRITEILLCGLVMAITTTLLTLAWAAILPNTLFRNPPLIMLMSILFYLPCSAVNGTIFKMLVRHPRNGEHVEFKWAMLTACVALMYSQATAGVLGASTFFVMAGQYVFALAVVVSVLSSYFCYYLSGRMVLQAGPPLKELLTCVLVMGLVGWIVGFVLGFTADLLQPLWRSLFMWIVRLPSLPAWIAGMVLLALFLTLISVPVVGRTMFNPVDGSRLPGASAFRIGLFGSVFNVLLLRLLLFLVMNSIVSTLAPLLMRGRL